MTATFPTFDRYITHDRKLRRRFNVWMATRSRHKRIRRQLAEATVGTDALAFRFTGMVPRRYHPDVLRALRPDRLPARCLICSHADELATWVMLGITRKWQCASCGCFP